MKFSEDKGMKLSYTLKYFVTMVINNCSFYDNIFQYKCHIFWTLISLKDNLMNIHEIFKKYCPKLLLEIHCYHVHKYITIETKILDIHSNSILWNIGEVHTHVSEQVGAVADLGGAHPACAPLQTKISLIS